MIAPTPSEQCTSRPASTSLVRLCPTGLNLPEGLSYDEWAVTGQRLSDIVDSSAWWLGDWLVFGKSHYAERYQIAVQNAGLSYQTLRNYAWVARRFPRSRRHSTLSFKHHAEVASLPTETQDRLLTAAEHECWTTSQLRAAIRRERAGVRLDPAETRSSRIDVPVHSAGLWRQAADHAGVAFDEWVRATLDRAAQHLLVPAGTGPTPPPGFVDNQR